MNLGDDNTPPDDGEQRLAEFLASFDEVLKTGAAMSSDDKASEEVPSAAGAELQRAQDCLRLLEEVWPRHPSGATTARVRHGIEDLKRRAAQPIPARLGRFQVRREVGRGGFGAVYQAYDPQLGREVALKVPHAHVHLDADLKARFQQEARAAAVLDHPNIVQVYEAGEADGVAYLALAFCPGITLAEWLHARAEPVPLSDAAALVAELAAAVQHAHERGIIHRDLKPANILMQGTRSQESGVRGQESGVRGQGSGVTSDSQALLTPDSCLLTPRIADFGLAKHVDAAASLTLSGTILGTPCYMAPEQAGSNPNQAGPAADVYSLGAILYELLTGQPPFHGDTPLQTLHQVRYDDPVSPSRLRRTVPADLTTICLKCLAKEPHKRYLSAAALAEDLRCFLDGRPIHARPLSSLGRAARWCRRKPVVAALLATVLVAVVAGIAGVVWQWQRAEDALEKVTQTAADLKNERDRVVGERDRAERNLTRARNLVDRLTRLAAELGGKPGLDPTSRKLFQEALVFHQEMLQEKGADPALRLETARGFARVANIHFSLRQWDKGVDAFRQGIDLLDGLRKEFPATTSYRTELARVHRFQAHVLRDSGKHQDARAAYDAAIALEQQLVDDDPHDSQKIIELANSIMNSAYVLPATEKAEFERRLHHVLRLQRDAVKSSPETRSYRLELALGLSGVGSIHIAHREYAEAEELLHEALQLRLEANREKRDRLQERYLAELYGIIGKVLALTDRLEGAERNYREGLKIMDALVEDFPTRPGWRQSLAFMQVELCELLTDSTRLADINQLISQALAHHEKLEADHPTEPVHLRNQASAALLLGQRQKANKNYEAALKTFERMLAVNERLVSKFPDDGDRNNMAWDLSLLGETHELAGNLAEAARRLRQSRDAYRQLADDLPEHEVYGRKLATRGDELTRLLRKAGKTVEAKEANRSAVADWQKLVERFNRDTDRNKLVNGLLVAAVDHRDDRQFAQAAKAYRDAARAAPDSGRILNGLAWFLATCPDPEHRAPADARQFAERAVKLVPKSGNFRNTLGVACYRAKDYAAAVSALDEAIRLRGHGTAEDWFFQAMARWHLHDKEAARRDYQRAVEWMRKNAPDNEELLRFRGEAEALLGVGDEEAFDGLQPLRKEVGEASREPVPDKLVVLTFDDASKSHFTVVRPLLKKYGFGATFFVTEGFDFPTNRRDYMSWQEIAQLHKDGFEIGNHTRDHVSITDKTVRDLAAQVRGINDRCKEHGIPVPTSFAYPGNALTVTALPILKDLGIRFARRGGSPEYPYKEGRGFAYEPGLDHPLLIPSAGDARPAWKLDDFKKAVDQAKKGKIAVLQFHGVPDTAHDWVNTSKEQFEEYLKHLADHRFRVIAMRDLARYVDPDKTPVNPLGAVEERKRQLNAGK